MKFDFKPKKYAFCTIEANSLDEAIEKFEQQVKEKPELYFDAVPNEEKTAKYAYEMSIPVFGRYDAVVYSDEQLTKEEMKDIAFEQGDFGELCDCDTDVDVEAVYSSGDFKEEEEKEL